MLYYKKKHNALMLVAELPQYFLQVLTHILLPVTRVPKYPMRGSSPHKYPKTIQPINSKGYSYFLTTKIPMWYLKVVVERSRATLSRSHPKISRLFGFVKVGTEVCLHRRKIKRRKRTSCTQAVLFFDIYIFKKQINKIKAKAYHKIYWFLSRLTQVSQAI